MAAKSLPTLRRFISLAVGHGVEEKEYSEVVASDRRRFKFKYLQRGKLAVVLPKLRESDRLTETMFEHLVRALQLEEFKDDLR